MVYQKLLRARSIIVVAALGFAATGCNIHPLPENVSRASTYDIVARVRCEVQELLDQLRREIDPSERAHADRIINLSVISVDFNFDMSEGNNIKNPEDGKPGASVAMRGAPTRTTTRAFFSSFRGALKQGAPMCVGFALFRISASWRKPRPVRKRRQAPQLSLPNHGCDGMGEVVSTYVKLELLTDVARKSQIKLPEPFEDDEFDIQGKSIAFSDVLRFTTLLSAGVNPQLT